MGLVCNQCPEETISPQACQLFHGVKWSWRGCLSGQQTKVLCSPVNHAGHHHQDGLSHLESGGLLDASVCVHVKKSYVVSEVVREWGAYVKLYN